MLVRPLSRRDLNAVAAIHVAVFPDSALALLGEDAVRRFYDWLCIGPHSASASGAFVDNECVGFYFGGIFRGPRWGFIQHNRTYLVWRVITHPWLFASRIFRDGAKIGRQMLWARQPTEKSAKQTRSFRLLVIAVNPRYQRSGIGTLLMLDASTTARKYSFDRMELTTHPTNDRAIDLCEKLGWHRASGGGNWNGLMRNSLNSQ